MLMDTYASGEGMSNTIRPLIPASFPLGRAWFVAHVVARCELDVKADVEALGFEVFCPIERRTKVVRGRKVEVSEPVFRGYLFMRFDREADDWGSIEDTDGVLGILRNNDIPVRVPDKMMDKIRNADDLGLFDAGNALKAGEAVEIIDGPFASIMARVKSASKRDRIKIITNWCELELDATFLRRV